MDNISKALTMAGAMLIAIMLISLFMWFIEQVRIYNGDVTRQANYTEIESFNRYFVYAQGVSDDNNHITGIDMINLIGKVRDVNNNFADFGYTIDVTTNGIFTDANIKNLENVDVDNATWNLSIEKVSTSTDPALTDRIITYEYGYDDRGRINRLLFTR